MINNSENGFTDRCKNLRKKSKHYFRDRSKNLFIVYACTNEFFKKADMSLDTEKFKQKGKKQF